MKNVLAIALGIIAILLIRSMVIASRLRKKLAAAEETIGQTQRECEAKVTDMIERNKAALLDGEKSLNEEFESAQKENERIRAHYQSEAARIYTETRQKLAEAQTRIDSLSHLEALAADEANARALLAGAIKDAEDLKAQADAVLSESRTKSDAERSVASLKAREIHDQADRMLARSTAEASRIIAEAHQRAEQIGGDAYTALRERDHLEDAVKAIRNVIDGYGDRYIVPTRSLLDDLAAEFGHLEAGQALALARQKTRHMVEQGLAADCDYSERNRKETAIRFVVDAFNGRIEAILGRSRNDNFGTLEQEMRDVFSLVNQNGEAFRNACILPEFLESRIAELKWAVVAHELKLKEREEQRRIKEQIKEEERARREYERAMKEAQREEEIIKDALEKARREAEAANAEQRAQLEQKMAELSQKLVEAEAKNQRALSMAQQTRKGNVYIISNVGSFGDDVFKIGMTRRLEPMERIYELSDASVPFEFDVHAIIPSDDAPSLEYDMHEAFDDLRVNHVNYRKEFFRVPLARVREFVSGRRIEASFTMTAEAHEYRESQAIAKMSLQEREKYQISKDSLSSV